MDFSENDNEVFNLLTHLKNAEIVYPAQMMASRRQAYQKKMTALGIGLGTAGALKNTPRSSGGAFTLPPIAGTIIESILIVAIVAESAAVAYVNRDKIMTLFRNISGQSTIQEVVDTPIETMTPIETLQTSYAATETAVTTTVTAVGTPSPELLLAPADTAVNDPGSVQTVATPNATDNNGNQYGLTPKPERTKDPVDGDNADNDSPGKVPSKKP